MLQRKVFIAKVVREFYKEVRYVKHDNPNFVKALKLEKRCLQNIEISETEILAPPTKSKDNQPGGGKKPAIPEVRKAHYDCFIDIKICLKGRLPKSMFKALTKLMSEQWLSQQPEEEVLVVQFKKSLK